MTSASLCHGHGCNHSRRSKIGERGVPVHSAPSRYRHYVFCQEQMNTGVCRLPQTSCSRYLPPLPIFPFTVPCPFPPLTFAPSSPIPFPTILLNPLTSPHILSLHVTLSFISSPSPGLPPSPPPFTPPSPSTLLPSQPHYRPPTYPYPPSPPTSPPPIFLPLLSPYLHSIPPSSLSFLSPTHIISPSSSLPLPLRPPSRLPPLPPPPLTFPHVTLPPPSLPPAITLSPSCASVPPPAPESQPNHYRLVFGGTMDL